MRVISNSEVALFNSCEYKHFVEFGLGITRKQLSISLDRGTAVHQFLEIYYRHMRETGNHEKAVNALKHYTAQLFKENEETFGFTPDTVMNAYILVDQYLKCYGDESSLYRILMVEEELRASTPDPDIDFGMKLDMLVEFIAGPYKGHIVLMDHKTCYNFYTQAQLDFNSQIPKYIGTLRGLGLDVNYGMFNQLRYRNTQENKANPATRFHRDIIQPSEHLIKRVMQEHWETSQRITYMETLDVEQREEHSVRVLNHLVCDNCMYSDLCFARLNGESDAVLRAVEYKVKDDRYTPDKEKENV